MYYVYSTRLVQVRRRNGPRGVCGRNSEGWRRSRGAADARPRAFGSGSKQKNKKPKKGVIFFPPLTRLLPTLTSLPFSRRHPAHTHRIIIAFITYLYIRLLYTCCCYCNTIYIYNVMYTIINIERSCVYYIIILPFNRRTSGVSVRDFSGRKKSRGNR